MSITVTIKLASGQSAKDIPLELLSDGTPIATATIDANGRAVFDAAPADGARLAVRVDRSNLPAA